MTTSHVSQRAAQAPDLPTGTIRFLLHCIKSFRNLILFMLLMEAGQAVCNILVPYAIKAIMDGVVISNGQPALASLQQPLALLAGLVLAEILFSRISGAVLITIAPRLRKHTTESLFAYLQYHSIRYFANHFAGALAHRISETATSVNHTIWSILGDFWPISITFGVSIALLFGVHPDLGIFVAGWVLIYVLCSYWLATRCQNVSGYQTPSSHFSIRC